MSQNQDQQRKALGRGLAALIGEQAPSNQANIGSTLVERQKVDAVPTQSVKPQLPSIQPVERPSEQVEQRRASSLSISQIVPNPRQPRQQFNVVALDELAASIREHGILQPIVVKSRSDGKYDLIAGERRWRAGQIAGLTQVPVHVLEGISDQKSELAALVENLQREDLGPVELAEAYESVMRIRNLSQEQLAEKLGVSRVSIANTVRLLKLPQKVRAYLNERKLTEGQARALLSLEDPNRIEALAGETVEHSYTVREVEGRVRQELGRSNAGRESRPGLTVSNSQVNEASTNKQFAQIEEELRQLLGAKVSIRGNGVKGTLEVMYTGEESLGRILHLLRGLKR